MLGADVTGAPRALRVLRRRRTRSARHRLYQGAGLVLRCPACGDAALVVTVTDAGRVVRMLGAWTLRLPS